jgi:alpha-1,3-rhamnosyl/mannosyltransferase
MRIAIGGISLLGPLTGIGQYTLHLSQELCKLDHDVNVFLGNNWRDIAIKAETKSSSEQISLIGRALRKIKANIPGARSSLHQIRQKKFTKGILQKKPFFDLYHEPNFIPWNCDIPTIITIHDLSWIRYPETHPSDRVKWLNDSLPKSIDKSEKIIVVSDFVKREMLEVFGNMYQEKICTVYNGVSNDFHQTSKEETVCLLNTYGLQYKSYILAVGTIEPRKNLSTAILAYSRLKPNMQRNYPLVIVGKRGWLNDELDKLINSIPAENLRFTGYIPQQDLPAIYTGATMMLYPSIYEGFGLPTIEAMSCGTPVITSTADAIVEVVNGAAKTINPYATNEWQYAIEELIECPKLQEQLSFQGRKRAADFRWDKCAKETLNVYQSIFL